MTEWRFGGGYLRRVRNSRGGHAGNGRAIPLRYAVLTPAGVRPHSRAACQALPHQTHSRECHDGPQKGVMR